MIIGNGIAGTSAVEAIREVDPRGEVVVVSDEDKRPYSRVALRQYIDETMKPEQMFIRPEDFYTRCNVTPMLGTRVAKIGRTKRLVTFENGETLPYRKLLLAIGAQPLRPKITGDKAAGIFVLNTWADADRIMAAAGGVKEAVVVGEGFIGTEAAEALHHRGVKCSIVEVADRVLPRMLDAGAAQRVLAAAHEICNRGLPQ